MKKITNDYNVNLEVTTTDSTYGLSEPKGTAFGSIETLSPKQLPTIISIKQQNQTLSKEAITTYYHEGVRLYKKGDLLGAEQSFVKVIKPFLSKKKTNDTEHNKSYSDNSAANQNKKANIEDTREEIVKSLYHLGQIYLKQEIYFENYAKAAAIFQYCDSLAKKYLPAMHSSHADVFIKSAYSAEMAYLISIHKALAPKNITDSYKEFSSYKQELIKIQQEIKKDLDELEVSSANRIGLIKSISKKSKDFFSNEQGTGFLQKLIHNSMKQIGPIPSDLKYSILGLGSLASHTITPWSDVEFMILINKDQYKNYFEEVIKLTHIKVINIGETPLRSAAVDSLNNFRTADKKDDWLWDDISSNGFSFDGPDWYACKTPLGRHGNYKANIGGKIIDKKDYSLIDTPENIAAFQVPHKDWHDSDKTLVQALRSVTLVDGSKEMLEIYKTKLKEFNTNFRDHLKKRTLDILKEDMAKFALILQSVDSDGYFEKSEEQFDVKKLYRALDRIIDALANSYDIDICSRDIWNVIDQMHSNGVLNSNGKTNLEQASATAIELRFRAYGHYKGQKELMISSNNQNHSKEKTGSQNPFYLSNKEQFHHLCCIILELQELMIRLFTQSDPFVSEPLSFRMEEKSFFNNETHKADAHMMLHDFQQALVCLEKATSNREERHSDPHFLKDMFFLSHKTGNNYTACQTAKTISELELSDNQEDIFKPHAELIKFYKKLGEVGFSLVTTEYDQLCQEYYKKFVTYGSSNNDPPATKSTKIKVNELISYSKLYFLEILKLFSKNIGEQNVGHEFCENKTQGSMLNTFPQNFIKFFYSIHFGAKKIFMFFSKGIAATTDSGTSTETKDSCAKNFTGQYNFFLSHNRSKEEGSEPSSNRASEGDNTSSTTIYFRGITFVIFHDPIPSKNNGKIEEIFDNGPDSKPSAPRHEPSPANMPAYYYQAPETTKPQESTEEGDRTPKKSSSESEQTKRTTEQNVAQDTKESEPKKDETTTNTDPSTTDNKPSVEYARWYDHHPKETPNTSPATNMPSPLLPMSTALVRHKSAPSASAAQDEKQELHNILSDQPSPVISRRKNPKDLLDDEPINSSIYGSKRSSANSAPCSPALAETQTIPLLVTKPTSTEQYSQQTFTATSFLGNFGDMSQQKTQTQSDETDLSGDVVIINE